MLSSLFTELGYEIIHLLNRRYCIEIVEQEARDSTMTKGISVDGLGSVSSQGFGFHSSMSNGKEE